MNDLVCSLRKDIKEYLRGKKNLYFSITLFAIGTMVIVTTLYFPDLIRALADKAPNMISDVNSLDEFMANLFPDNLKGSLGIWYSDVGVFYTIVIALTVHGLVMGEVKNGKWILPVASGYKKRELLLSKVGVYAAGAAFPVLIISNLYYYVVATCLENNLSYKKAFASSLVMCIAVAVIVVIIILSSILYRNSITAAISMILIVMVAPDVLTYFTFGKFMPTYILTFVYQMSDVYIDLVIPIVEIIVICALLMFCAMNKLRKIEIAR